MTKPPVSAGGFSFYPQDENFSSWGVSFLGQKRAVGKWGVYTVISKNWLFFRWMFSFGHSRCLPIEEGTMSTLAAKQTFSRGCFFGHLAAYHLRKKIFFLLGLPFTHPYLRIYEDVFRAAFRPKVMVTSATSKIFFAAGWLWPPQMSGYVKGLFFGTV